MDATQDVEFVRLNAVRPSPENDRLYRPVDPDDPEVVALAESIAENGLLEPLLVTQDGWILSGHRRHAAARVAGLDVIPCRSAPISRADDIDRFVHMLRECNRYREKTLDEKIREEVVSADPREAYESLLEQRRQRSDMSDSTLMPIEIGDRKPRKAISDVKHRMLAAAICVINERRDFWPLSDRSVHYALLNDPPLRNTKNLKSTYANDSKSYSDLTDLLTRARLTGDIPWQAIADETRPVTLWQHDPDPQPFIRRELDGLLKGYWRNYQQSQPHHIEILAEKLTVRGIVQPVAQQYGVPLTIGRGFSSIPPRRAMAERFRKSGRDRFILLILSDFDPDGESIAESFARSIRDDFGIESVTPIKVALTADQARSMNLPVQMTAKRGSPSYRKFKAKHGDSVFELEAIPPATLQQLLRDAIDKVLDIDAFNAEIEREQEDAAFLETLRRRVLRVFDGDIAP